MPDPITNVTLLVFCTFLVAGGQLLFKSAGLAIHGKELLAGLTALLQSPTLYLAAALYGAATFLWVWLLSRVPLSVAYPWMGLTMALVPLAAVLLYGEMVRPIFWAGLVLIAVGVMMTQYGAG